MKGFFELFASHIKEPPISDKVQYIVKQWSESFQKFFTCDNEILICIANTYKFDNRFRKYINQYSNEDLSDFIYQAIIYFCEEKGD